MRQVSALLRFGVTLAIVAVAIVVGWQVWDYYEDSPWTRDGVVSADVVQVAPDVTGLITAVSVTDNQKVRRGDPLFTIDHDRFALALAQADASLAAAQAAMQDAGVEARRYNALNDVAASQSQRDAANARAAEAAASYGQALAARNVAQLNLDRTDVRAPVNGIVTNLDLQPGDYAVAGKQVLALVDTDTLHVNGYFEETKLPRIRVGDRAEIWLMGESTPLQGHVASLAGGIADQEREASATGVASINPVFAWVRLAARIPVRVAIDRVPAGIALIPGRTATVDIFGG
jgi:RND family efflux transporter MFP subunit